MPTTHGPATIYNPGTSAIGGPPPWRLKGNLAPAVLTSGDTYVERIYVQGMASITLRAKCSAVAGSPTIQVVPILADAGDATLGTESALTGTQAATGLTTATALTGSEVLHTYVLLGERFVDIVVYAGTGITLTYVDVFLASLS